MNQPTRVVGVFFPALRRSAARWSFVLGCLACLVGQAALAAGAGAAGEEEKAGAEAATQALPMPSVQLVALSLREMSAGTKAAQQRAPQRLGMHLVVRLAVADMVSHPDSGDFNVVLRSRLLHRSIARAPLAVGVAWRF